MDARDIKFLNAFLHIPHVGGGTARLLKKHFTTFEAAWNASDFARLASLSPRTQDALKSRVRIDPDKAARELIRENIWVITEEDEQYPAILREIPYPPFALFGQGNHECKDMFSTAPFALGIVGTRRPTRYGIEMTEKIASEIAAYGGVVISGLASGIDTAAHRATLDNKGKTIAVLGSGIDRPSLFPKENIRLADKIIASGGTILSEYPPGARARKEYFPQRNRIISGLSQGVLVVEAREKSGALITARFALDQNREVFAIPGSILSPTSQGPHRLIQEGAKLVTSAKDILEEFGIDAAEESTKTFSGALAEKEESLLLLLEEPLGVDMLKQKNASDTASLLATLSLLELKGLIKNLGGDVYQKIN